MIPFKTSSALDHFAVIQPRRYLLFLLPVGIYDKSKVSKMILRDAGNKMRPHFILFEDVFCETEAEA